MALSRRVQHDEYPDWILAFGPFFVLAILVTAIYGVVSLVGVDWLAATETLDVLVVLTGIGFVAGILPVIVGMLWFPYFRRLDLGWIHAVLAFSAGILAYIAVEMALEAVGFAAEVPTPFVGESVAIGAVLVTVATMELASRWRSRKTASVSGDGLRVAYLVAIGLGLHSIGEGLAIGSAYVLGDVGLVALLTLGFIIHNVTEGPAVIAALAREQETPPLRHFAALGLLAGGGVILGGWIGSFVDSALVATLFFAIAFGAIVQVLWEMAELITSEVESLVTRRTSLGFVAGLAVLFLLEEVIVDGLLL
ncbi:zinc transporter, ZIP family [Halalkaliarchaeum desulfuricum]|uniref:Zinc transporter, ZIP family n=1 Tax=Halalkaliarchaeum desulfuricum TaxID=2055893 RepID=A0A343TM52_9EURY|nr:metal cation transporter [Halalkaliarchaeum desulfuricum]AUX10174.1 zinc transporter, ZIP family [Halalkaliarchaeum desulfuricum]